MVSLNELHIKIHDLVKAGYGTYDFKVVNRVGDLESISDLNQVTVFEDSIVFDNNSSNIEYIKNNIVL